MAATLRIPGRAVSLNPRRRPPALGCDAAVTMTDHIYKSVELTGSSESSVTDAIDRAVAKAAETLRQLDWFEVVGVRGVIDGGRVAHYQVTLKVGFRLED
jgi:flavin-binding protein dodecin